METLNIEKFVALFAQQFEDTDASLIKADTAFRELEEWDSLIALSIIAMVDEEFQVKLSGDDIRASKTIAEIFEKVKAKLA